MALTHEQAVGGLHIDDISVFTGDTDRGGIIISWSGDIGFGEYVLTLGDDMKLHGHSECMEKTEDKYFSKELFRLLHDMIVVED